jgi:hypothetical protein
MAAGGRVGPQAGCDVAGLRAQTLLGDDDVCRIHRAGVLLDGCGHRIVPRDASVAAAERRRAGTFEASGAGGPALHDGKDDRCDEGDDEDCYEDVHAHSDTRPFARATSASAQPSG